MVDVGGQHGAPLGDLATHELGRYVGLDARLLAIHVLAYGHVLHLGRHDAAFGIRHLRYGRAALGAVRQGYVLEPQRVERAVVAPHAAVFGTDLGQSLHVAARGDPLLAQTRQALAEIDRDVGIAESPARVVKVNVGIGRVVFLALFVDAHARHLLDAAHGHADLGMELALDVDFVRT